MAVFVVRCVGEPGLVLCRRGDGLDRGPLDEVEAGRPRYCSRALADGSFEWAIDGGAEKPHRAWRYIDAVGQTYGFADRSRSRVKGGPSESSPRARRETRTNGL